jgi:hypothetical protein
MLAADGCASSSSYPVCWFCGVWAPGGRGSGGRHLRALTRLGMLICRCECVAFGHLCCLLLYRSHLHLRKAVQHRNSDSEQ